MLQVPVPWVFRVFRHIGLKLETSTPRRWNLFVPWVPAGGGKQSDLLSSRLEVFRKFFFGNARTSQKRMRRRTAEIIWSLWKMKIWQELSLTFLGWLQRLLLVVGGSYWLVVIGVVSLAMTWSRVIPKSAMFQCLRGWEVLQGLSTGGEKGGAGISCYGVWANRMGNQWQGSRAKKPLLSEKSRIESTTFQENVEPNLLIFRWLLHSTDCKDRKHVEKIYTNGRLLDWGSPVVSTWILSIYSIWGSLVEAPFLMPLRHFPGGSGKFWSCSSCGCEGGRWVEAKKPFSKHQDQSPSFKWLLQTQTFEILMA